MYHSILEETRDESPGVEPLDVNGLRGRVAQIPTYTYIYIYIYT